MCQIGIRNSLLMQNGIIHIVAVQDILAIENVIGCHWSLLWLCDVDILSLLVDIEAIFTLKKRILTSEKRIPTSKKNLLKVMFRVKKT